MSDDTPTLGKFECQHQGYTVKGTVTRIPGFFREYYTVLSVSPDDEDNAVQYSFNLRMAGIGKTPRYMATQLTANVGGWEKPVPNAPVVLTIEEAFGKAIEACVAAHDTYRSTLK